MSKRMPSCDTGVVVYLSNGDGYHISEIEKSLEEARQPVAWIVGSANQIGGTSDYLEWNRGKVPYSSGHVATPLYTAPPAAVPVDVYAAYETWPADIRAKLSLHDLRRMSGWAAKSPIADWRIDTSAGGPILVYKDCSVIEGEDARYVLSLIERDQPPVCCTEDGNPIAPHPQPVAQEPFGWLHTYKKTGASSLATYPIDMNLAFNKERWECVALYTNQDGDA